MGLKTIYDAYQGDEKREQAKVLPMLINSPLTNNQWSAITGNLNGKGGAKTTFIKMNTTISM